MQIEIPKDQLTHGAYYEGECRNASVARWNQEKQCFFHWRYKFGLRFVETIKAPEDESRFDVFITRRQIEPTEEIPFEGT